MRRRKPSAAANGLVFHRPKPKPAKPNGTTRRPGRDAPVVVDVRFATPKRETPDADALTFHTPKRKGQREPGQPNGSCWEWDGEGWRCVYGCKFIRLVDKPADNDWHHYNCRYWWEEGIHEAPF